MNTKKITLLIAAAGIFATSALWAQMNMDGMEMNHSAPPRSSDSQTAQAPLPEPAQTVFANYFNIQTALTTNSLEGVSGSAAAIERAIRFDAGQTFSSGEVGSAAKDLIFAVSHSHKNLFDRRHSAEDLATAANLSASRQVFKRLSDSLVKFVDSHPEYAGHFVKVYCPMANAMWLQSDSVVNNPYLGKDQAGCGQIKN